MREQDRKKGRGRLDWSGSCFGKKDRELGRVEVEKKVSLREWSCCDY